MSNGTGISTIQRAFELARAGACHSVADIRTQLSAEGHDGVHGHLNGSSIQQQLKALLSARGIAARADADALADA